MKKLIYILVLLTLSSLSFGQALTSVTATLTDSQSTVWANASITAQIQPPFGNPSPLNNQGGPIVNPLVVTFADGSGTFSMSLDDNLVVAPSGSTYLFTICPNATVTNCSTSIQVVHGGSMDLSASLSADLTNITVNAAPTVYRAYVDAEVTGGQGSIYWRTTDNMLRGFNGSSWVAIGSGGGGGISRWDQIISPTANLSLGMGNFTNQFQFGNATGSGLPSWDIFDSNNNTGTGILFRVRTAPASTEIPVEFCTQGTTNCIMLDTSAVLQALGSAQIIATSVINNASGVGEIFLGSNGTGVVSGTNQVAIMGNNNQLYASENGNPLAKVLLGGTINCPSSPLTGSALRAVDINGGTTCTAIPFVNSYTTLLLGNTSWITQTQFDISGTQSQFPIAGVGGHITVTRLKVYTFLAPTGCSVQPGITLTDGTTSTSVTIANGATSGDSGVISVNYTNGGILQTQAVLGTGCTNQPGPGMVQVLF